MNWRDEHILIDLCVLLTDLSLAASFISLFRQVRSGGSDGVSMMSVIATVLGRALHALAGGVFEIHYVTEQLPYQMFLMLDYFNGALGLAILLLLLIKYRHTYDFSSDDFGGFLLAKFGCDYTITRWLFFLTVVFLYGVGLMYVKETSYTNVNIYATACDSLSFTALLPQLWMFNKGTSVPFLLGNFVFFIICHRAGAMAFYFIYAHTHGLPLSHVLRQTGCEAFNILIAADFLYCYIRAKLRGEKQINVAEIDQCVEELLK